MRISLLIIFIFSGCSFTIHESDLLSPSRASLLPNDSLSFGKLKGENIAISSEPGVTLRGISLQNPSANKTIIYFYGNGGKLINQDIRTTLDSLAIELDANFVSFDYRGYGFSDGDASLSALLTDALKIYDTVKARWSSNQPIYVFGRSIGAGPAMYVTSERKCAGMILQSPPASASEVIPTWTNQMPWYESIFVSLRPDSALANLKPQTTDLANKISVPTLIIHGSKDDFVLPKFGKELFEKIASPNKDFVEIPGVGHWDLIPYRSPVVDSIRSFLDRANLAR
jgi:uncharacterized protein